jgi:hypothetical protein
VVVMVVVVVVVMMVCVQHWQNDDQWGESHSTYGRVCSSTIIPTKIQLGLPWD